MSRSIRLRPRARADLQDIWRYTATRWGVDQASSCTGDIETALRRIAENPAIGADRRFLHEGLRKAASGSHSIYYLFDELHVDVVRVLHNRMDVSGAL